jgi:hypothetical protein
MDDLFDFTDEPMIPIVMPKDEFVVKTRKLLSHIDTLYGRGWQTRALTESEYPVQSVCDLCTGCGTFTLDGVLADCVVDYEDGQCVTRYFESEEFGLGIEECLDDLYELLMVDKVD